MWSCVSHHANTQLDMLPFIFALTKPPQSFKSIYTSLKTNTTGNILSCLSQTHTAASLRPTATYLVHLLTAEHRISFAFGHNTSGIAFTSAKTKAGYSSGGSPHAGYGWIHRSYKNYMCR